MLLTCPYSRTMNPAAFLTLAASVKGDILCHMTFYHGPSLPAFRSAGQSTHGILLPRKQKKDSDPEKTKLNSFGKGRTYNLQINSLTR